MNAILFWFSSFGGPVVPDRFYVTLRGYFCRFGPAMGTFLSVLAMVSVVCPVAVGQTAHFVGVQTGVASGLGSPIAVAVDAAGNVYVADFNAGTVYKETLSGGTYTQSVVASGFNAPGGVAVDTSGNVYVADTTGTVYLETLNAGTYVQSTVVGGLLVPTGVAVDGSGNVYVADQVGFVYLETLSMGSYTQTLIGSGFTTPSGVAVDGSGNVYVADNRGTVFLETLSMGSYTQTTIGSGLASPFSVAVDAGGNVYVADASNDRVYKETLSMGSYTQSTVATGGLAVPQGVAVNAAGTAVYVADSTGARVVRETFAAAGFGSVNVGTASTPVSSVFSFDSGGTLVSPAVLTQGTTGLDFADAATGSCTVNGTGHIYSAGDTCTVNATFTPLFPGGRLGAAVLYNGAGAAIATGYLFGSGLGPEITFPPGAQSHLDLSVNGAQSIASDGAGNLYLATTDTNRLLLETLAGGNYSETTIPTTTLSAPGGVAVDGAGNVYVADTGNSRVIEEMPSGGNYTEVTVPTVTTLASPQGVAVDGSGNVYILDSSLNVVLKETLTAGIYSETTVATSGLSAPQGIAVDGAGDVYLADSGNSRVVVETLAAGSYSETSVDGSLSDPTGLAVDGTGNVFVADAGPSKIYLETLSGGMYTQTTLRNNAQSPTGVAVDGVGDAFYVNGTIRKLDLSDLPNQNSFPDTVVGATSAPVVEMVENVGNAALLFPVPNSGSNPTVSSNLSLDSSGGTACPAVSSLASMPGSLAAAASCTLTVAFAPQSVGPLTGTLSLTDTTLNAVGPGYAVQTNSSYAGNGLAQTDTIAFTVPDHTFGDVPFLVSASSASSGTFTYGVVSGPATIAGATVTLIGAGTVVLSASQAANGNFAAGSQSANFNVATETPTITFTVPNHTYGDVPFVVSASSASSGGFTYAVVSGPATIVGATVTLTGAGTVMLSASQAANGNYATGSQNASFTVATETPTITFTVPNHTYGDAPFLVSASSASSGAFTYAVVSGPATISGATVTLTGAGTVVLSAGQAPNGNYATGSQNASFTVATGVPTIAFTVPNHTYGDVPFVVSASSASSGAFTYGVMSGPATISGATVTLTGAGTVVLSAGQAPNGNYATGSQNASFTVATEVPTIAFTVPNHTYGDLPFVVSASSASSGAFTYAVVSGPATIAGATVTLTGAGMVVLSAGQAANGNYATGSQNASFTVATEVPTIAFTVPNHTYGDVPFVVSASSASSGAFTYGLVSGPATISGATVTLTGAGAVVLSAIQAANGNYATGSQNASFTVATEVPTIAFTVPNHTYGDLPFVVSASSASSGTFTYGVVSGPATISGATVTLTGAGTVVLSAGQAANGNYATGSQNASFTAATEVPTITFTVPNHTYDDVPFVVSASSASIGAFTYGVMSGPATISGATVTLTGTGTVVLSAGQAPNGNYATGSQNASFTVATEVPTIAFTVPNHTYGDLPFVVSASSASSGAFTYAVVSGPATIAGATVTLTGAGTVVLSAGQAANGNYATGSQNASFIVATETPTIAFTVPNHTYGDAPFVVSATSASSGAFTYGVVSGPATIVGSTVTLTGAGTVVLSASQAANGNYATGSQNASFTVATETPAITFSVPNHTFGDAPFVVLASSASSGAFIYAVVSGPATIVGATVTLTGAGTVVLSASQVANGNYATGSQNASFTVATQAPSITFTVPNHTFGDAPFTVSASSASSGAFTYAVMSGPATLVGATVTLTGSGTVVLAASQATNGNYATGSQNASFTVATQAPSITFTVPNHTFGDAPFTVSASSASSGAFTYGAVSGPATIAGATVTLTGAGTVVLSASQAANGNYATGSKNASFTVAPAAATITFNVPNHTYGDAPFTVSASSASSGVFTYAVISGPATIVGATVTLAGAGTVVLSASQAASTNYASGITTASFTVAGFGYTFGAGSGASASTSTVFPGGTVLYTIPLTPAGATFPDPIVFSVSGVPPSSVEVFSPASIAPGTGATTVTMTLQVSSSLTAGNTRQPDREVGLSAVSKTPVWWAWLVLPIVGLGRLRRLRGKRGRWLNLTAAGLCLLTLLEAGGLAGCSGNGPGVLNPKSYTVVITATDQTTGATGSVSFPLTVE